MADQSSKHGINIGTSSLILIFIVLCLATFGLLSLSSAKGDMSLAQKNADAVKGYYRADNAGQEFLRQVDQTLKEVMLQGGGADKIRPALEEKLKGFYIEDTDMIMTEIPMERAQALHIELKVLFDIEKRYEIEAWKVVNTEDYAIDDSMPVWTGTEVGG